MKKEIIQHIKDDTLYDYIANNYYKLDKSTLKNILLEYIYAIHVKRCEPDDIIREIENEWEE